MKKISSLSLNKCKNTTSAQLFFFKYRILNTEFHRFYRNAEYRKLEKKSRRIFGDPAHLYKLGTKSWIKVENIYRARYLERWDKDGRIGTYSVGFSCRIVAAYCTFSNLAANLANMPHFLRIVGRKDEFYTLWMFIYLFLFLRLFCLKFIE